MREASRFYNILWVVQALQAGGVLAQFGIPATVTGSVEISCRPGVDPLSPGEISDRQLAFVSKFNANGKLGHA